MVNGLKRFQEHFQNYSGHYVLIGGAACDLIMEEAALDFRATKDLDIVLLVEVLNPGFVRTFWEFVSAGKYKIQQQLSGMRNLYRFSSPIDSSYPSMLELFSKKPNSLRLAEGSRLTPLSVSEDISSLSAILLDDEYYQFLHQGRKELAGVSIVDAEHLIPLKAKAWLDLSKRKTDGHHVDSKTIAKHKNDVFRLLQVISIDNLHVIPDAIRSDMNSFLAAIESESIDLKNLGFRNQTQGGLIGELRRIYSRE